MDFKIAQSELSKLKSKLSLMGILALSLLLSNILLAMLCWYTTIHQTRTIVPVVTSSMFSISDSKADASYLEQMALFFATNKLDVSPSTIKKSHAILLQYCAPEFFHDFSKTLSMESQYIIKNKVSSSFYLSSVKANPSTLSVLVSGNLKRWVGERALADAHKIYSVSFDYRNGKLAIKGFSELKEKENV